jgi:carbamate kinase
MSINTAPKGKIVIAIGGNSLIKNSKQISTFQEQLQTVQETAKNIAKIVRIGYRAVITHGNGPQVGDILIRSFLTRNLLPDIPLEMANAITQSQVGFMIQQSLRNELIYCKCDTEIVTVVTQVVVSKKDSAFINYTKPVGPFYSKKEAYGLQNERKWVMREDAGRGYRRMVSSPTPIRIVEIDTIRTLIDNNTIVIAGGGGGIPVIQTKNNKYSSVAAVIDKDLTSALLAEEIAADVFLISTSIDCVYLNYNKPNQKALQKITLLQAEEYYKQGHFESGSMGPKIMAAIKFLVSRPKGQVIITNPINIANSIIDTKSGTRIIND